jgi:hypothetical protein
MKKEKGDRIEGKKQMSLEFGGPKVGSLRNGIDACVKELMQGRLYYCFINVLYEWSLKTEAARSSKMLAFYSNTTLHYNPEDLDLNLHHYENLNSHIQYIHPIFLDEHMRSTIIQAYCLFQVLQFLYYMNTIQMQM